MTAALVVSRLSLLVVPAPETVIPSSSPAVIPAHAGISPHAHPRSRVGAWDDEPVPTLSPAPHTVNSASLIVIPAPHTVIPAPPTLIPAPPTVIPAPATVIPAPATVIPANAGISPPANRTSPGVTRDERLLSAGTLR